MRTASTNGAGEEGIAARVTAALLAEELDRIRGRTLALVAPLPDVQLERQVRPFMSPLIWDLGHIADFERLWLVDAVEGRGDARLEGRFDALDTPRSARGEVLLPSRADALATLAGVRADVLALLPRVRLAGADALLRDGYVYRMVMQHEAQHQETMLQTLDLPADDWGYAGSDDDAGRRRPAGETIDEAARVTVPAGVFVMGTGDRTAAYDNERPRHEAFVEAFEIERYPVSNARWMQFVDDGGYRRPELWSVDGRAWLQEGGVGHPQGWKRAGGGWRSHRFGRSFPLDPSTPVQHVCFWEAEAFASWSGARLPTEVEWEKAAAWGPEAEAPRKYPWGARSPRELLALVDLGSAPDVEAWQPPRIGQRPRAASAYGVEDLLGSVYQWTSSEFRPYEGFEAFPYPGYSEVFFGTTYRVLRGSSWAADEVLWRNTYRNWDLPQRRQVFAGVRLVYDL